MNYLVLLYSIAKVVNYKVNKGVVDITGAAGAQNIQGKTNRNLMFMLKFYSNINKIKIVHIQENDVTVEVIYA
jgi:hypothetical protein